ncbi:hypothetical protein EVJ58_g3247 [Rhodofomes roseus]|uniref:Uncharacterized protein n=1 Tax=Rhodofomes roseus TaxID=34475 RepID=A0A4Y9YMU2_9APHY|nr:hypothetical protein EVJ58_g3247 [Rhodofomes roseus]
MYTEENRTASGSDSRRTDEGSTQPASTTEASTSAHALDSSDDEAEQPAHLPPRSDEPDVFGAINTSSTPPLTPGGPSPSRSTHRNNGGFDSPYDPLATPAFRHSPRVSRQPWRFPSPSHPLYASKDKELPLAMLVRGFTSPMVHGSDNSPFFPMPGSEHKKRSVFSSPFVSKDTDRISFLDESPARLVFDGTPLSARLTRSPFEARSADSPLGQSQRGSLRVSSWTEATKKWQAEAAAGSPRKTTAEGSGLLAPIELQGDDVFTDGMYSSFIDFNPKGEGSTRSPSRATVAESPVVRTQPQTSLSAVTKGSSGLMSFGSGLMDAFLSGKTKVKARRAESSDDDSDSDMSGPSHGSPIRVGKKTRRALSSTWSKDDDGDTEMTDHHPKKRRRTFSGRD